MTDGNGVITNDTNVDENGDGAGTGTVTTDEIDDGSHEYHVNTQTFLIDYCRPQYAFLLQLMNVFLNM